MENERVPFKRGSTDDPVSEDCGDYPVGLSDIAYEEWRDEPRILGNEQ